MALLPHEAPRLPTRLTGMYPAAGKQGLGRTELTKSGECGLVITGAPVIKETRWLHCGTDRKRIVFLVLLPGRSRITMKLFLCPSPVVCRD